MTISLNPNPKSRPLTHSARGLLGLLLLWVVPQILYASNEESQNPAAQQAAAALYQASCSVCHGVNAQGQDTLGSPALAGQSANYLTRQLKHFSSGVRGGDGSDAMAQQMRAISLSVPQLAADPSKNHDRERDALVKYLATLPVSVVEPSKGDLVLGYKLYQASCGSCHGGQAQGNDLLNSPRLAGLSASYLTRQYQQFLAGGRGAHAADKYGRQMKMIAATLTDPEKIDAVIAHITSIAP